MDAEKCVAEIARDYDFPTTLKTKSYYDNQHDRDVVQVFFRYHPFSDDIGSNYGGDKFGAEVVCPDNPGSAQLDVFKHEVNRVLEQMESSWKDAFQYVFYRDVPYAINDGDGVLTIKCELCNAARSLDQPDIRYRKDLYLIYMLREIECDCDEGWEPVSTDIDLSLSEGELFHRPIDQQFQP